MSRHMGISFDPLLGMCLQTYFPSFLATHAPVAGIRCIRQAVALSSMGAATCMSTKTCQPPVPAFCCGAWSSSAIFTAVWFNTSYDDDIPFNTARVLDEYSKATTCAQPSPSRRRDRRCRPPAAASLHFV